MLNLLEKRRIYSAIVNAMKEEEKYNKNKKVLSAREILELSKKRYLKMVSVLEPLKEALGKDIEIINMYFSNSGNIDRAYENAIIVEYKEDNISKIFTIMQYDEDYYDVFYELFNNHFEELVDKNKKIIRDAFIENDSLFFEETSLIPSTSKQFIIGEDCGHLTLKDISGLGMEMTFHHFLDNRKGVYFPNVINSTYSNIKDCLNNEANIGNILSNVKFYEEDVPKYLIKK